LWCACRRAFWLHTRCPPCCKLLKRACLPLGRSHIGRETGPRSRYPNVRKTLRIGADCKAISQPVPRWRPSVRCSGASRGPPVCVHHSHTPQTANACLRKLPPSPRFLSEVGRFNGAQVDLLRPVHRHCGALIPVYFFQLICGANCLSLCLPLAEPTASPCRTRLPGTERQGAGFLHHPRPYLAKGFARQPKI
jgi:hypothetical protein